MAFWSTVYSVGAKSTRLQKYFEAFQKHEHTAVHYFGMHEYAGMPKEQFPIITKHDDSYICTLAARIASKLSSPLGRSSIGRMVGITCLSNRMALADTFTHVDVLFCQPYFWHAVRNAKKKGVPVILEIDSDHPLATWSALREREHVNNIPRRKADPWNYFPYVQGALQSIEIADKIVVFSDHAEETFLERGYPAEKICKLRPPLARAMKRAAQKPTEPKFVFASNHPVRKGLDITLTAWKQYCLEGGRGTLMLCGVENYASRHIFSRFDTLERVTNLGEVHIDELFADEQCILISPSFSEGRPRTVLEALGSGTPVIASKASTADLVEDGVSGWIVDTTPAAICRALHAAQEQWHRIDDFSDAAFASIQNELDSSEYYELVHQTIRELVEQKNKTT